MKSCNHNIYLLGLEIWNLVCGYITNVPTNSVVNIIKSEITKHFNWVKIWGYVFLINVSKSQPKQAYQQWRLQTNIIRESDNCDTTLRHAQNCEQ